MGKSKEHSVKLPIIKNIKYMRKMAEQLEEQQTTDKKLIQYK